MTKTRTTINPIVFVLPSLGHHEHPTSYFCLRHAERRRLVATEENQEDDNEETLDVNFDCRIVSLYR